MVNVEGHRLLQARSVINGQERSRQDIADRTNSTGAASGSNPRFTVRLYQSPDAPHLRCLVDHGLLPGHTEYESDRKEQIRKTFGSDRERVLVAEAAGRIIGSVAVVETRPNVGHLHWLRVDPNWQADLRIAEALIKAATEHARAVGLIKLAVHVPVAIEEAVKAQYRTLGFAFSRPRDADGVHVLEFYLNLYESPGAGERDQQP